MIIIQKKNEEVSCNFTKMIQIAGKTPAACKTKDVKITVPLKIVSNFWRSLEIPLINREISLDLTWSKCHFFCS